jgi:hypothetical protein
LDLTVSITFLRNHDLDPTSATGDGTREGIVKEVAGVTIVALVDDEDPECETEDGVEERGGEEKPDWDPAPP